MAEVLKVNFTAVGGDSNEHIVCAAPSNDTVTILSITICERAGADEAFNLFARDGAGSTDTYIYDSQSLPAASTFEHTSKLVLETTDDLVIQFDSSATADVIVSYLQQDN
mgnify:FL=1